MNDFSRLLDELAAQRGARPPPPQGLMRSPRPAAGAGSKIAARQNDDAGMSKALADLPKLLKDGKETLRQMGAETREVQLASIHQRGRDLVKATRTALREAVAAGKMTAIETAKAESFLNNFVMKLGI